MASLGSALARMHQRFHRCRGLQIDERDHAQLGVDGAQRVPDDSLHERVHVDRGADLTGKIIEQRQFLHRPLQVEVLFRQSLSVEPGAGGCGSRFVVTELCLKLLRGGSAIDDGRHMPARPTAI